MWYASSSLRCAIYTGILGPIHTNLLTPVSHLINIVSYQLDYATDLIECCIEFTATMKLQGVIHRGYTPVSSHPYYIVTWFSTSRDNVSRRANNQVNRFVTSLPDLRTLGDNWVITLLFEQKSSQQFIEIFWVTSAHSNLNSSNNRIKIRTCCIPALVLVNAACCRWLGRMTSHLFTNQLVVATTHCSIVRLI